MTAAGVLLALAVFLWRYPPGYIYRVQVWQASDAFDWQKFPSHPLKAAPTTYHFETAPDLRVEAVFEKRSGADDWNSLH